MLDFFILQSLRQPSAATSLYTREAFVSIIITQIGRENKCCLCRFLCVSVGAMHFDMVEMGNRPFLFCVFQRAFAERPYG